MLVVIGLASDNGPHTNRELTVIKCGSVPCSLSLNEYHTTAPQNAVMVNSRISPFHAGANHYSKEGDNCREDPKLFTEEAADVRKVSMAEAEEAAGYQVNELV